MSLQNGPKLGSNDEIISYSSTPQLDKWSYMRPLDNTDHINCTRQLRIVNGFHKNLAAQLGTLPTIDNKF